MRTGRGAAVLPGQRSHVDDPPVTGLGQVGAEHLAAEEHAAQVETHHGIEFLGADLHQWRGLGHGGVVDHYVQGAEVLQHLSQRLLEIGLAANVQPQRQHPPTPSLRCALQALGAGLGLGQVTVRDHHVKACGQQPGAEALAQPLAGPGYQCNLVHDRLLTGCSRYRQGYRRC